MTTAASIGATVGVIRRRVPFDVNSNHGNREPGTKGSREDATDEAHNVDVAVLLADVDAGLEHQCRKGNTGDPGVKGKGHECAKDEEHDASGVVFLIEIEDGGTDGKDDVEDAGHPDKRLREHAGEPDVQPRQDDGSSQSAGEQDDCVGVE